ncbi:MAG: hypothetical protein A3I61_16370 [Acidobacteria bacterium RIFCSPLOWO2_02_FULL_68_18]|nr:MAG: hypothetical protein A3I61_16370 [Acidobacteria bacterium RIFCSPLOWO2_02_FULL_68_18]OFW48582.1 MAG: hypothetical protein A3G77_13810 [Acidobacteria bacterium RIFCSPLOWO2_12_FULL_68_19]
MLRNTIEGTTADETLFEDKQRVEVTLNSIGDAVISTDISGNVTYLNAVAERMTGRVGTRRSAGRSITCSASSMAPHARPRDTRWSSRCN